MQTVQTEGISANSPGEALGIALSGAVSAGHGAARTYVIVQGITKTAKGWKAVVLVVTEPKPEEKPEPRPEDSPEDVRKKQEAREEAQLVLENTWERVIQAHHDALYKEIGYEDELMLLYIELSFEDVFQSIADNFNFNYVHYMKEGPLMDEARAHPLGIEMDEAAHDIHPENTPEPKNERRPKKEPALAEELIDE